MLLAGTAAEAAGPAPQHGISEAARYGNCLNAARAKPQDGFAMAEEWRDNGGGAPAQHCLAVSLVGMKQYGKAADLLQQIAKRLDKSENDLRADLIAPGRRRRHHGRPAGGGPRRP